MSSAIELYQQAYDADYRKGDWEYAKELYEAIRRKYPHSEEAEYCRVHLDRLEKLKSDPHNHELQPVRSKQGTNALSIMSLVLILPLIVAVVVGGYYIRQQYRTNLFNELLAEGQINERAGLYDPAVQKYEAAQTMMPANALSYRLLAEIYLQNNKLPLAQVQYKGWQLTYPDDPDLSGYEARMKIKLAENAGHK
jgi:outer membrane protein assembly factor BamD (BamD/ComL family)